MYYFTLFRLMLLCYLSSWFCGGPARYTVWGATLFLPVHLLSVLSICVFPNSISCSESSLEYHMLVLVLVRFGQVWVCALTNSIPCSKFASFLISDVCFLYLYYSEHFLQYFSLHTFKAFSMDFLRCQVFCYPAQFVPLLTGNYIVSLTFVVLAVKILGHSPVPCLVKPWRIESEVKKVLYLLSCFQC